MPGWRPHREVIEMARGKNDKTVFSFVERNIVANKIARQVVQKNGSGTVSEFSSLDPYTTHYPAGGRGVLPYKRLIGMCRWMGSYFNHWIHYKQVAFAIELLE